MAWIGLAAILLVSPLDWRDLMVLAGCSGLVAVIYVIDGVRRFRPVHAAGWVGIAVAVLLVGLALITRGIFPQFASVSPDGALNVTDYVTMLALACTTLTLYQLGRWKDDPNDSTAAIDALILTSGGSTIAWLWQMLPVLTTNNISPSVAAMSFIFSIIGACLGFSAVRLLLISAEKTVSGRRLAVFGTLAAVCVGMTLDSTKPFSRVSMIVAILAMLILAWSAQHESMARLAAPGVARNEVPTSISRLRLIAIAASSLVAPGALLYVLLTGRTTPLLGSCLVIAWGLVAVLLSVRLAGLVRNREAVFRIDRRLAASFNSMTAAKDMDTVYERTIDAIADVLELDPATTEIAILTANSADTWALRAHRGLIIPETDEIPTPVIDEVGTPDGLANNAFVLSLLGAEALATRSRFQIAPLFSQDHLRGCLLIGAPRRLNPADNMALRSVAGSLIATMDAFSLSESEERRRNERHFRALVENSTDVIFVTDREGHTKFASPAADRLLTPRPSTVPSLLRMLDERDQSRFFALLKRSVKSKTSEMGEFRLRTVGGLRWLEVYFSDHCADDLIGGIVINARDISERKRLEDHLRYQSLHDDLTGIANRKLFRERVRHAVATRVSKTEASAAVLFIDIDDFKTVNDGLGHTAGDELLKSIASRLSLQTGGNDTAARLGGDEFALLLTNIDTESQAKSAAERVLRSIVEPLSFGNLTMVISASIGVTMVSEGTTMETLLRDADVAMYHAKREGKNQVRLFHRSMSDSALERLELKAELPLALERRQLHLEFQRVVDLKNGYREVSHEALLRWTHPTVGNVPPASFIPLAEEIGCIMTIGDWVLEEACRQLIATGHSGAINVNVSPTQLTTASIVQTIERLLARFPIAPERLVIEVTEGSQLENEHVRDGLSALGKLGCRIAMDDFGSGFASYAAVQRLPFTDVKIDRSLVSEIGPQSRALAQIETIVQMGHALGLSLTAEGVETQEQAQMLAEIGVEFAQGNLFGRPGQLFDGDLREITVGDRTA